MLQASERDYSSDCATGTAPHRQDVQPAQPDMDVGRSRSMEQDRRTWRCCRGLASGNGPERAQGHDHRAPVRCASQFLIALGCAHSPVHRAACTNVALSSHRIQATGCIMERVSRVYPGPGAGSSRRDGSMCSDGSRAVYAALQAILTTSYRSKVKFVCITCTLVAQVSSCDLELTRRQWDRLMQLGPRPSSSIANRTLSMKCACADMISIRMRGIRPSRSTCSARKFVSFTATSPASTESL